MHGWFLKENTWVFPKIGVPPNRPFVHRVFHYVHHPFSIMFTIHFPLCSPSILGVKIPLFLETPTCSFYFLGEFVDPKNWRGEDESNLISILFLVCTPKRESFSVYM